MSLGRLPRLIAPLLDALRLAAASAIALGNLPRLLLHPAGARGAPVVAGVRRLPRQPCSLLLSALPVWMMVAYAWNAALVLPPFPEVQPY